MIVCETEGNKIDCEGKEEIGTKRKEIDTEGK
jgi:hypothetical protein